ncbi:MAG TPA: 16S rRNA (adenine(1518)-N(6)/adenine(1519)-N(6))-dimethyltransferase RsmA [Pirellulales bacterium]|nr:16S rRNA (adenine(1518)-N(6)/adenine(1519)-N(6))-dimethyltransferase RsmA [Pirellulales bacterium]
MTARQTQSFLMRRFEQAGILPKTRHGQNFLIDLNLLDLLFESARIEPHDVVLEVGTGTGSLTAKIARAAAAVVTVELDPQMHQLASEELIDFDHVLLMRRDALKNKNRLNPDVLAAVKERLSAVPGACFKLAANLPYNIATPIISNLLACDIPPDTMTVTIQKELADRIVARPCTKDYGALSVWVQSQCEAEIVRLMPPAAFWPRPKVTSAIIHIRLRRDWRERIGDLDFFHSFARTMFFHRRKFLRSVILSGYKGQLDKPTVDALMAELGFGETTRAEELDVATMLRLSETIRSRLPVGDAQARSN